MPAAATAEPDRQQQRIPLSPAALDRHALELWCAGVWCDVGLCRQGCSGDVLCCAVLWCSALLPGGISCWSATAAVAPLLLLQRWAGRSGVRAGAVCGCCCATVLGTGLLFSGCCCDSAPASQADCHGWVREVAVHRTSLVSDVRLGRVTQA